MDSMDISRNSITVCMELIQVSYRRMIICEEREGEWKG